MSLEGLRPSSCQQHSVFGFFFRSTRRRDVEIMFFNKEKKSLFRFDLSLTRARANGGVGGGGGGGGRRKNRRFQVAGVSRVGVVRLFVVRVLRWTIGRRPRAPSSSSSSGSVRFEWMNAWFLEGLRHDRRPDPILFSNLRFTYCRGASSSSAAVVVVEIAALVLIVLTNEQFPFRFVEANTAKALVARRRTVRRVRRKKIIFIRRTVGWSSSSSSAAVCG